MALFKSEELREKGFSLVELSLVLVIVGLIISVGVGVMNSLSKKSKITREKANLRAIKNSLTSYALSRGTLPAANPPGELPYLELNLSSAQKDTWGLPYRYDVSNILTTTNSQNFCVTLYQLDNVYGWYGQPPNVPCNVSNLVCVTDTSDTSNDGRIASATQGYFIGAYISSRGEDKISGGKNSNSNREYEMSSNPMDVTIGRDDLVQEISFSDLSANVCNAQTTAIEINITNGEAWLDNSTGCLVGTGFTGTVILRHGQTIYYQTGCTGSETFEQLARCNVSGAMYTGSNSCNVGTSFDGKVSIDAVTNAITQ